MLAEAAREEGIPVVEGGTVVVIAGPRFSTRAESRWYSAARLRRGQHDPVPGGWLARELELCYANVSLVTDYDVGLEGMPHVPPVSAEAAFRVFAENLEAAARAAAPRHSADRPAAADASHALVRDRHVRRVARLPAALSGRCP